MSPSGYVEGPHMYSERSCKMETRGRGTHVFREKLQDGDKGAWHTCIQREAARWRQGGMAHTEWDTGDHVDV